MTPLPENRAERIGRLIFFLEEYVKPHAQRHPDAQAILNARTVFNMCYVYVGKRTGDGPVNLALANIVGIAALCPWFQSQGLGPAFTTHPQLDPVLDICGLMLRQTDGNPIRVYIDDVRLAAFFGFTRDDWIRIVDPTKYMDEYLVSGSKVRPKMVLDRLLRMTMLVNNQGPLPADVVRDALKGPAYADIETFRKTIREVLT